jgi:hypothetical protein
MAPLWVLCQKEGNFANKCTFPKKLKSKANTDMGMFVGVAISDSTAEDMHNLFSSTVSKISVTTSMIRLRSAMIMSPVTCAHFGPWTLILRRIRSPYLLMFVRKTIRFTNMSQMLLQTFLSTNQNQSSLRRQAAKPTPLSIMTMSVRLLPQDRQKNGNWTPVLHAVSSTTRAI